MSPVADCDLKTFLDRVPFPESDLIVLRSFFGCLAASVQYLHGQKCRHKDIKPANILVKGTNVLLTDFGTARDWSDKSHGTTVGPSGPYTAGYVAPEVVDQEPRNDSSDIWSLGCVFLDIVTVLKGETSESRKAYFSSRYSGGVNPRTNPEATKEWLARLEASSAADNEPLVWIKEMLQPSRFNRISASSLFDKIVNHNEQHRYVGPCCTDDDDSDIASYTGSTYQENITNPLHQEVAETSGTLVNKKDPENENIKLEESEYIPEPRHFLVSPLEDHNGDITRKSPNSSQLRWTLDASEERRANTTNKFEPPNPPSKPAERQFESQKPFDRSRGGSNYTRSGLPPINSLTTADNQLSPIPADPHHTNPLPNDPTYLEAVGSSSKPPLHPRKENEPRPAEAIIRADPPSTETSWFRRMFRRKYNQAQPDSDPPTNAATADYDTTEPAYGGIRGTADFVRSRDASPAPPLRNAYSAASSYTQPFAARHDVDTTLGISDFHA
ncbi:kinase-like protein [Patellaria atrata CBS 101060]|uniref:non-specific serine/threonine protein kinase n=1 Tax=Patellaria atrata CBS 101060 TaxID=1346257 RepID=A0A9P4SFA4_9PEZI|nr:kinase-like protein [Patellaria atrata CBS 101060]